MNFKVIYIDRNEAHEKYKISLEEGDRFFTIGFGGTYSREFKKVFPDIDVECWKADPTIKAQVTRVVQGVTFRAFPSVLIKFLGQYSTQLYKALNDEVHTNPNIVVNISSCKHLLFHQLAPALRDVPLVVQAHGETTAIFDLKHRIGPLRKIKAMIEKVLEKRAFKSVDHYYILDQGLNDYLPSSFAGTTSVQTTGVNEEMFKPIAKREAKKMLGLDETKRYILFVGRLDYTKRVDILIDTWKEIKGNYPDWGLLLAGNLPGMPLTESALEAGAIVKDRILQTEMYKYLSASDIYVLSKYLGIHTFGGVGMLPVQALFCETPFIGVTVRNIPAEIREQVGIYASEKEEIKAALESIMSGKRTFSNLREKAIGYYSWRKVSEKTNDKYLELLKLYTKKNE